MCASLCCGHYRHGALPLPGRRWNFFLGFLPCGPPLGLGWPAGAVAFRRTPCSGAPSRFPGASMISSSLSSSHSASVRCLSGIAKSSCRRRRGEPGCGSFMATLSHRSTRTARPCVRERRHGVRVANCGHEPVVASRPSSPTLLPGGEGSVVLPARAGRFMGRVKWDRGGWRCDGELAAAASPGSPVGGSTQRLA